MKKLIFLLLGLVSVNCVAGTSEVAYCPSADEVAKSVHELVYGKTWTSKNKMTWQIISGVDVIKPKFSFREALAYIQVSHEFSNEKIKPYEVECFYSDNILNDSNVEIVQLASDDIHSQPFGSKWKIDSTTSDCSVESDNGTVTGTEKDCPFEIKK